LPLLGARMNISAKREIFVAIVVAISLVVLAHLGVTTALGAHPWWSLKIAYIGVGIGAGIYFLMSFWHQSTRTKLLVSVIFLTNSTIFVWLGKARFVASYGDDIFAGKMWFYGWMAVVAWIFVLIVVAVVKRFGRL